MIAAIINRCDNERRISNTQLLIDSYNLVDPASKAHDDNTDLTFETVNVGSTDYQCQ